MKNLNIPNPDAVRQYRIDTNNRTNTQERKASYLDSVAVPEYALGAKIPSYSPLPTNAMHMKSTIKFQTNVIGDAAIVVNPYYLADSDTLRSYILINNNDTMSVTTNAGAGNFIAQRMGSRLTAGVANAYRLVSAAIHIYPEISSLNAQGYIAGGIVTYANQVDYYVVDGSSVGPFGANSVNASILDQAMYYQKAQVGNQAGIRAIYLPFDPSFEFFCPPNVGRVSLLTTMCDQFYWNYYITGTTPRTNFVIEIYYNFELEPNPSGVLQLLSTPREFDDSDKSLIKEVIKNPAIVSQSNTNLLGTAQAIDQNIRNGNKKTSSFLNKALMWLSENSANITNVLSAGSKLLTGI